MSPRRSCRRLITSEAKTKESDKSSTYWVNSNSTSGKCGDTLVYEHEAHR